MFPLSHIVIDSDDISSTSTPSTSTAVVSGPAPDIPPPFAYGKWIDRCSLIFVVISSGLTIVSLKFPYETVPQCRIREYIIDYSHIFDDFYSYHFKDIFRA